MAFYFLKKPQTQQNKKSSSMAAFSPHCQLCNFCINCWLELRYDFCHTELLIYFESIHVADGF